MIPVSVLSERSADKKVKKFEIKPEVDLTARNLLKQAEEKVKALEKKLFSKVKVHFGEEKEVRKPTESPNESRMSTVKKTVSESRSRSRSAPRKFTSAELQRKSVPSNASLSKHSIGFLKWRIDEPRKNQSRKTPPQKLTAQRKMSATPKDKHHTP